MLDSLKNALPAIQSFGIVSGFGIAAYTAWRNEKSRKVANHLLLTKYHREVWELTLKDPELNVVRSRDPKLWTSVVREKDRQFLTFVFLHISCSYELISSKNTVSIQGLKSDLADFLMYPLPARFWEENKRLYNKSFVEFVDSSLSPERSVKNAVAPLDNSKTIFVMSALPEKIIKGLASFPDRIIFASNLKEPLTKETIISRGIDMVVCFGCSQIFNEAILGRCRVINIHGGLLPLNRGPNPNLWSWLDNTAKGVSIHEIDAGIDTGPVFVSQEIFMDSCETLQSSYDKIVQAGADLFNKNWEDIRLERIKARVQTGPSTKHTFKDQRPFEKYLNENLNTPIDKFVREVNEIRHGLETSKVGAA